MWPDKVAVGVCAGQEAVWLKVLPRWGVSQEELQAHFGGPGFLAWQRMGNIHSYAGPLPMSWIQDQAGAAASTPPIWLQSKRHCNQLVLQMVQMLQMALVLASICPCIHRHSPDASFGTGAELQRRIVGRMRRLGMTPVFPAFAGLVPDALVARYPQVGPMPCHADSHTPH